MTNEEYTAISNELDRIKLFIAELVNDEPHFNITGAIKGVNVVEQRFGYLHYISIEGASSAETYTVYYPDNIAPAIGELISSANYISVKATVKPNDFGSATFWIYGADDIVSIDGQRIG